QFPVVTEVCAFYQRTFSITGPDGPMAPKQWVRHEWARSGLSLQRANEACGVKNAATRKYLTKDWLWYWPSGEMTDRLAVLLARRRAAGHRGRLGRAAIPLAARARGHERLVAAAAARHRAAQGDAAPGRAPGVQPDLGQLGAPEPEAARVHGTPDRGGHPAR